MAPRRSAELMSALDRGGPGHAPARRARSDPPGEDGRPGGGGRRARGAEHLLGRVPARRGLQPAAAVGAGQDGRRHHPGVRCQPHRPRQRPPGAEPERADVGDRHPPPHGRAGRPLDRRAGDLHLRGHGDRRRLRRRPEAHPRADPAPAHPRQPGHPDARALPQPPRRGHRRAVARWRWPTSSPCATSSPSCSARRWCDAWPRSSRWASSSSASRAGSCGSSSRSSWAASRRTAAS